MIVVYWLEKVPCGDHAQEERAEARFEEFPDGPNQIGDVLERSRQLHKAGHGFVTSTSHHCAPVDGVKDGKLPDGSVYQWRKRRSYDTPT